MQRIMIIGSGGAGKSTLARQLGEKLGLPVVHLDKLFWQPGWVQVSQEEFDEKLALELEKPTWIIDGNFNRTIPQRLARCDTVIYLDFDRVTCLLGALKRVLTSLGKTRPDMADGCPERLDWEFLKWVWNFNRDGKRERYYRLLNEAEDVETIVLKNRRMVKRFLDSL